MKRMLGYALMIFRMDQKRKYGGNVRDATIRGLLQYLIEKMGLDAQIVVTGLFQISIAY